MKFLLSNLTTIGRENDGDGRMNCILAEASVFDASMDQVVE